MKARVRLIGQALEEYAKLKEFVKSDGESSESATLLRSIDQKIEWLKENPLKGEVVKKKDIPKNLDADNLFKLRIARYWRMLYTITREEIEVFCFVLVLESHDEYDDRFGYKKR